MKSLEMTTLTRSSIFSESLSSFVFPPLCCVTSMASPPPSSSPSTHCGINRQLFRYRANYGYSSENQKVSLSIGLIWGQLSRQWHRRVPTAALMSVFLPWLPLGGSAGGRSGWHSGHRHGRQRWKLLSRAEKRYGSHEEPSGKIQWPPVCRSEW